MDPARVDELMHRVDEGFAEEIGREAGFVQGGRCHGIARSGGNTQAHGRVRGRGLRKDELIRRGAVPERDVLNMIGHPVSGRGVHGLEQVSSGQARPHVRP